MTYTQQEKTRQIAWKMHTAALPDEARYPAPYIGKDGLPGDCSFDFCVPGEFARYNLLPEVRAGALELFAELGIPWHASANNGPTNHLVSSQVQCVNALMPMVRDPARLVRAFGATLGTAEVLEIEPGRYLTFEYIGPEDFFNEAPAGDRVRGAHCTSVDAAFLHRTIDGIVELVLVEWKYTEYYRLRRPDPAKDKVRLARYGDAVTNPDGPVRADVLAFEHLLDEPFYQLVRQQLLAHALEQRGAEGASRVRIVHVLPADNDAYQRSLARPEHRALGDSVSDVWHKLLRHPDRFIHMDPAVFLDAEITSREYVLRHCDAVVHDLPELLAALGVGDREDIGDPEGVEDAIDFEGTVCFHPDSVELIIDAIGTALTYPFTLGELHALSGELDPG